MPDHSRPIVVDLEVAIENLRIDLAGEGAERPADGVADHDARGCRDPAPRRKPPSRQQRDRTRRIDRLLRRAAAFRARRAAPRSGRATRRGSRPRRTFWQAPNRCRGRRRISGRQVRSCDQSSALEPAGCHGRTAAAFDRKLLDVGLEVRPRNARASTSRAKWANISGYSSCTPGMQDPGPVPVCPIARSARTRSREQRELGGKADVGNRDAVPDQHVPSRTSAPARCRTHRSRTHPWRGHESAASTVPPDSASEIDLQIPREHQADIEKAVDPGCLVGVTPVERELAFAEPRHRPHDAVGFEYSDLAVGSERRRHVAEWLRRQRSASVLNSCAPVRPTRPVRASGAQLGAFLLGSEDGHRSPTANPATPCPRRP